MGDHRAIRFPAEILKEWAESGVDLPSLFATPHLGTRMGIQLTEASPERVVGTMPVEGNTQVYGLLHGGASAVLAESLGGCGAILHAGPGRFAVGIDLNATHHRSARSGLVTGVATALHRGRSSATYDIAITDEDNRRICSARLTCTVRGSVPNGPEESAG
ncbi:hotdog fold thioesterase [Streptomyces pseudoechinosporeus]